MTRETETRNDRLRAADGKLQDAVAEIVAADDWRRMLGSHPSATATSSTIAR